MDQRELIEQITKEVMTRLNGPGSSLQQAPGTLAPATLAKGTLAPATLAQTTPATVTLVSADMPEYIDHTLLKPGATEDQVDQLCAEAREYQFYSVCVNSSWVEHCARQLRGTGVKVCAVVGFPLGAMDSRSKSFETRNAIEHGADEIDMVINVGAMKSGRLKVVEDDIRWVLRACRPTTVLKVILENALLSNEEKVLACQICKKVGVHFVKTSTGFAESGAKVEDVALMRRTVGPGMGIKAAGGIRDFETARAMIAAGATRIGASASIKIATA